jgi:hypothetical protein
MAKHAKARRSLGCYLAVGIHRSRPTGTDFDRIARMGADLRPGMVPPAAQRWGDPEQAPELSTSRL